MGRAPGAYEMKFPLSTYVTRMDHYAAYNLRAEDEPFRRAVRDGFRTAGLSHAQFIQALEALRADIQPQLR